LQESEFGAEPCDKQVRPTTAPYGQVHALANLSARQAKELDLLTSGIFGRPGITSSNSAVLQRFLANRLQAKMVLSGSTLYTLTWKHRGTPSGLLIFALRASAHRTSDNDYGSWPTPSTRDYKGGYIGGRIRNGKISTDTLDVVAQLAGWPTPAATDGTRGGTGITAGMTGRSLTQMVKMVQGPARLTVDGVMLTGSTAKMESGGQLNPAHSRWLMGLPDAWDACVPMETQSTRKSQKLLSVPTWKTAQTNCEDDL
jgi:hypothetical protein